MNMTVEWSTRFCTVKGETGYFHTWEHYSKPLPASPLVGGEPAGLFSQIFGIVEFKDGVRRVDPTSIIFCDENNTFLNQVAEDAQLSVETENDRRLPDKYCNDIVDILTHADGVTCTVAGYEPLAYGDNALYEVPSGHRVIVNYNKMAKALYNAGYRKDKPQ